ncbi:hypothetical protein SAMN04487967_1960 [Natronorubrum sediminis]|uniref:GvpH protein n=1 Tax=Natronorubrum sediminis TaxID=640943 RepID=A0A1H6FWM7_9EURY|nr:hypothetical protein SAMN04487967_1960 [Natronorubrum sediminis]
MTSPDDSNDRREEPPDEHDDSVDIDDADDIDETEEFDGDASSDRGTGLDDTDGTDESAASNDPTDADDLDEDDDRAAGDASHVPVGSTREESTNRDGNWLSSLLSALESLERGAASGRRRTNRTVLDYDISIRSGRDRPGEGGRRPSSPEMGTDERPDRQSRSRTRRRKSPTSGAHLTTRTTSDELTVTADVAGTDPDDVTVGFDDSALVVAISGTELDRVEVPWRDRTADATIKNGILTVQVEPTDEGAHEGDEGGRSEPNGGSTP